MYATTTVSSIWNDDSYNPTSNSGNKFGQNSGFDINPPTYNSSGRESSSVGNDNSQRGNSGNSGNENVNGNSGNGNVNGNSENGNGNSGRGNGVSSINSNSNNGNNNPHNMGNNNPRTTGNNNPSSAGNSNTGLNHPNSNTESSSDRIFQSSNNNNGGSASNINSNNNNNDNTFGFIGDSFTDNSGSNTNIVTQRPFIGSQTTTPYYNNNNDRATPLTSRPNRNTTTRKSTHFQGDLSFLSNGQQSSSETSVSIPSILLI